MPVDKAESGPNLSRPAQTECLFLDKEGRWFHEDVEITHERTRQLFTRSLKRKADGTYYVQIGEESMLVCIEDTPFVVRSLSARLDQEGKPNEYVLLLSNGEEELLDLSTLEIAENNVMYCRVKNGLERARFLRPAYYHLCSYLECDEAGETCWLPWQGKRVVLSCQEPGARSIP